MDISTATATQLDAFRAEDVDEVTMKAVLDQSNQSSNRRTTKILKPHSRELTSY